MIEFALNVLDLIQNSVTANATLIEVRIEETENRFIFEIEDNGKGMPPEMAATASDPFTTSRTTRRMGFGLPFVRQLCDMTDGTFALESQLGKGTLVRAEMVLDHLDRPPLGDIAGIMHSAILSNQPTDFLFRYRVQGDEFELDTRQVKEVLDGLPLRTPQVSAWLRESIAQGIEELHPKAI